VIDPTQITDFKRSDYSLQEVILFWICAAGKNAKVVAKSLDLVIKYGHKLYGEELMPFDIIKKFDKNLANILKKHGIGCYNNKARTMLELVKSGINLKICDVQDLENIYGIGPKTARCFLIHSRKDVKYAGLDTHVLKFLRDKGYNVPLSTPSSRKKYLEVEKIFLDMVNEYKTTISELDLKIWNDYSSRKVKSETKRSFTKII
jgi:thermostable 8-oxoguanine DNA glycosylase